MNDKIKNFFSVSFGVLSLTSMAIGLYSLGNRGWEVSKIYFALGSLFVLIGYGIEITRAQNYDGDDF
jgi:hypothetical protein